jgi:hypothetical protein
MPRPLRATLQEMADAVARQVRRDGYLSLKAAARGLPVSWVSVRRRLGMLLPMLPRDVADVIRAGRRAPCQRRVPDWRLVEALTLAVRGGGEPTMARVGRAVGLSETGVYRRVLHLLDRLPDDVAGVIRGRLKRPEGGMRPLNTYPGPGRRSRDDGAVIRAARAVARAEGRVTTAAVARRLGLEWGTARRREVADRLPRELRVGPADSPAANGE